MLQSKDATIDDFLLSHNPCNQMELCHSPDHCYFGDSPMLSLLKLAYGSRAAELWLVPQLTSVSDYCGLKEKVSEEQLLELAKLITTYYHWLKTDELMLFFARFKATKYERFYSYFDPQVVLTSLKQFLVERSRAYDRRDQEIMRLNMEELRKKAVSYDEYLRLKEERKLPECSSTILSKQNR